MKITVAIVSFLVRKGVQAHVESPSGSVTRGGKTGYSLKGLAGTLHAAYGAPTQ